MSKQQIIAITGANGFIGKNLLLHLKGNYQIVAFCKNIPDNKLDGVKYYEFNLKDKDLPKELYNANVIIHLAHQFQKKESETDYNFIFSQKLAKLTTARIIFISSFAAALPVTPSLYGLSKSRQEKLFINQTVLRPALVIGNGGFFQKIKNQTLKSAFIPLIEKGNQTIQIIGILDLLDVIETFIHSTQTGIFTIAHPKAISYKEFVKKVAQKKIYFIKTPYFLLQTIANFFPFLGISKDNITGLKTNKYVDTTKEFLLFNKKWKSLEELI